MQNGRYSPLPDLAAHLGRLTLQPSRPGDQGEESIAQLLEFDAVGGRTANVGPALHRQQQNMKAWRLFIEVQHGIQHRQAHRTSDPFQATRKVGDEISDSGVGRQRDHRFDGLAVVAPELAGVDTSASQQRIGLGLHLGCGCWPIHHDVVGAAHGIDATDRT